MICKPSFKESGGMYLGKKFIHFAARTILISTLLPIVFIPEEIISEKRVMDETLEHDVKEACLT